MGFSLPTQRCFRRRGSSTSTRHAFLCLRRGVSRLLSLWMEIESFSLPTQRCFFGSSGTPKNGSSFLCLRRGVSGHTYIPDEDRRFSLPTQRCFVATLSGGSGEVLFSAYAEVFLRKALKILTLLNFSLPTQRCFQSKYAAVDYGSLFSAYAEVFPSTLKTPRKASPFLCLRRGVSRSSTPNAMIRSFSLPTQRCFFLSISEGWERSLFSAYAEVFL